MGRLLDKIEMEAVEIDRACFTDGITYDVTLTMEGRSEHFDWWQDRDAGVEVCKEAVLKDMEWDMVMLEAEGFYSPQELEEVLEELGKMERLLGEHSMKELFSEVNEVYTPSYEYEDEE